MLQKFSTDFVVKKLLSAAAPVEDHFFIGCQKSTAEDGSITVTMDVSGIEERPLSRLFAVPENGPTTLELADPAFFDLKSCLVNFGFCRFYPMLSFDMRSQLSMLFSAASDSPLEIITQGIIFKVPELQVNEVVILIVRSIGILRDNRHSDLPVGFEWTLNEPENSSRKHVRSSTIL